MYRTVPPHLSASQQKDVADMCDRVCMLFDNAAAGHASCTERQIGRTDQCDYSANAASQRASCAV